MSGPLVLVFTLLLSCAASVSANDKCTPQNGQCVSDSSDCNFPTQPVKHLCPDEKFCCLKDSDVGCTKQGGICQQTTEKCGRSYVRFLCGGDNDRRCCLPNADAPCTEKGGKCMSADKKCTGKKVGGLCGDEDRKCCIHCLGKSRRRGSTCGHDRCCKIPGFYHIP
ncbi:uncharacterized protein LOC134239141 [Saccostrea cucullata]|uniref:uncharacterized protein LOC134239141 n=1 Tax=Saccostrea cuccullata TaxID=36930 RepID=UPI002ED53B23